ncbi:P-loop containing nucleoside triphosphate hydrolase protein [Lentinula raphanica]|nr:P-loop containing nucleoside triphosphate hydrolase protein [Lentinula raphanica]KAJ3968014.1 P-loop containing nucleoside triphosphate hydrolase protein [Lentinula raphanica]
MSSFFLTKTFHSLRLVGAVQTPACNAVFRSIRFQSTAAAAATKATPDPPTSDYPSFETLKDVISPKTYKALVGEPMKLKFMTHVQTEVLSHLPELVKPHNPESPTVRDLLVRAKTGTGKTLAFLIPAIEARERALNQAGKQALVDSGLMTAPDLERRARAKFAKETVGVLILSPTRELATQIANEATRVLRHHDGMEVRLLTGGVNKRLQMREWMKGSRDVVVATTGRLRDLMDSEPEVLKSIQTAKTFILDEADTMLDMGFRDDIHAIQKELPPSPIRQTFLFSATVSPVIHQVATSVLAKDHRYINCVNSEDSPVHAHIPQYHTVLPNAAAQFPHILRLIAHDQLSNPKSKIILFLPTARMTQLFAAVLRRLSRELFPAKTNVYEIHSQCDMRARINASDRFRKERHPTILVTSDISARGVDYPGVTRVIQVGIPATTAQYIHRIGRTGRTGSVAGRGDLVLLPWEIGFITWQLTEIPIKPVTAGEITKQVEELASQVDSNPTSEHIRTPYSPRVPELETAPLETMSQVDPEKIRETFMSMLGYYLPKGPELRVQRGVPFEGCKDWTVQACGLKMPPFVSEEFVAKMGISDSHKRKPRQFSSSGQSPWLSRGNVKKRFEKERSSGWNSDRNRDRDSEGGFDRARYQNNRDRESESGFDRARSPRSFDRTNERSQSWSRGGETRNRTRDWFQNNDDNNNERGSYRRDSQRDSFRRNDDSRGGNRSWSRADENGERRQYRREYRPRDEE